MSSPENLTQSAKRYKQVWLGNKMSQYPFTVIILYWNRQARANSVDPDQTPQNAASNQGLHSLILPAIF